MRKLESLRQSWTFLSVLSVFWRLHQVGRSLLVPFDKLSAYLPEQGSLLDLGCGHGLFLALAKYEKPDLQLNGIDLSEEKIAAAHKAFSASAYTIPELAVMDILDFPDRSVDVISIIDVLYLVPIERWDSILKKCYSCLSPDGKLLLKEMDRAIRWKFALLYVEETLAVKILGLTLGKEFTFPKVEEIRRCLEYAGFEVEEVPLDKGYLVPHRLWIGSKRENSQ
jgi:cyclopropane fatty-acyl-phospholipid synthase-like methyltransferase